jgi:hypothetical protein
MSFNNDDIKIDMDKDDWRSTRLTCEYVPPQEADPQFDYDSLMFCEIYESDASKIVLYKTIKCAYCNCFEEESISLTFNQNTYCNDCASKVFGINVQNPAKEQKLSRSYHNDTEYGGYDHTVSSNQDNMIPETIDDLLKQLELELIAFNSILELHKLRVATEVKQLKRG